MLTDQSVFVHKLGDGNTLAPWMSKMTGQTPGRRMTWVHLALHFLILLNCLGCLATSACPSVCFCDQSSGYVSCVGDGLWEVPADIPRQATRLELRNYAIGNLVGDAFRELMELAELKLQQTQLRTIDGGTFGNLTQLVRLDLSQNQLDNVTGATFEGLERLKYLDLSSNRLVQVDDAFVNLVSVEQLNLRDNRITALTARTFAGLYKVQYLNVDSNDIASIEVGTFQYLTNLAHLIVSNNPLTTLSRLDFFGSRLQYIDVSRVGLLHVPQGLTRYVRDLRLVRNNLTHIRMGDFDSYPYLGLLVLDDNKISDIESDALGRQEYLRKLWLNGNNLKRIPANLPPSLRRLYAEENQLRVLAPYSFQGLFNLEQLFLQRNQIEQLEACAFCDLLGLRHLDLQANHITNLTDGVFANLTTLQSLDLSQNPITTLSDGVFIGLNALITLQLSRVKSAQVTNFSGDIFNPLHELQILDINDSPSLTRRVVNSTRALQALRNLRELNLMHNGLSKLRQDFPNFFPKLKVLRASENQWHCDRAVLWFTTWLKKADINFHRSYSIRCSSPPLLANKPIIMLTDTDFTPSTTAPPPSTTVKTTPVSTSPPTTTITTTTTTSLLETTTTLQDPTMTVTSQAPEPINQTEPFNDTADLEFHFADEQYDLTTQLPNDSFALEPMFIELDISSEPPSPTPTELTSREVAPATPKRTTQLPMFPRLELPNLKQIPGDAEGQALVIAAASVATGIGLLLLALTVSFYMLRWRKGLSVAMGHCGIMKSCSSGSDKSISYSPQRDEVSIVTISEGSVGLRTQTHHGLGNKLYFLMEGHEVHGEGFIYRDPTRDAFPDPCLQDLLPSPLNSSSYHVRT